MERKLENWKVGAFVFAGLFLLVVSIFLLGGNKIFQKYDKYWVEFEQVQGLNPGSVVSLAGINVGNVEQILLNPQSHKIQLEIRVVSDMSGQITVGTKADLKTQGALGDKYIYLIPGPADAQKIATNSFIPALESKDLLSVIAERGGEAEKVFDILGDIKNVTGKVSDEKRIERIMENLAVASENFKIASGNMAKVTANPKFASSVDRLDNILMRIEKGEGTLGALINDSTLHDQMKSLLGGSKNREGMRNVLRSSIRQEK